MYKTNGTAQTYKSKLKIKMLSGITHKQKFHALLNKNYCTFFTDFNIGRY